MRIAVIGCGAVGGYFGGRLALSGINEVIFVARGDSLEALKENGLEVESIQGNFHLKEIRATDKFDEIGPVEAVLVCVKAWQVSEVANAIGPLIAKETCVLPLQNGVDSPSILSEAIGSQHVLGGLCYMVASLKEPGKIAHTGLVPRIIFGELDGRLSPRIQRVREAFAMAFIESEIHEDIQVPMWEKFMFISSLSSVGALTRAPAGVTRTIPETRSLFEQAAGEILEIAGLRGIALPGDAPITMMSKIDALPANATASMQRDIMEGRPSELDFQTGAVVKMARSFGLKVPFHSFAYNSLLPLELRARAQVEF